VLQLTAHHRQSMREHALSTYPAECCGILFGTRSSDVRILAEVCSCSNIATDTSRRYEISPVEAVSVQRQARAAGLEIIGFYHSHPNHPAVPSQTDAELAAWPDCSYVIVSVHDGTLSDMRSWVWRGDTFTEEAIETL
jgi:proteasome lid subunit RPN8/RPN11